MEALARTLYQRLQQPIPDAGALDSARAFLHYHLDACEADDSPLPAQLDQLPAWLDSQHFSVGKAFEQYQLERQQGAPRRYFSNISHALDFLRHAAPTKLVDGAWLYGCCEHWNDPRFAPLVRTYLEELGDGLPSQNHVLLYQQLVQRYHCEDLERLPDSLFVQGALQLALGALTEEFLPEVVGFNLSYEQLPLHLLITRQELAELNLDPYYFVLHITIDNADSGHAIMACQATQRLVAAARDPQAFYRRVRRGAALAERGIGTPDLIRQFDLTEALDHVLAAKAAVGLQLHHAGCRVGSQPLKSLLDEGRNDGSALRAALLRKGWLKPGQEPLQSRFWRLIHPPGAQMYGVFSLREQQLLLDWLGSGSSLWDSGRPQRDDSSPSPGQHQQLLQRLAPCADRNARMAALVPLLGPSQHSTPLGLLATRAFRAGSMGACPRHWLSRGLSSTQRSMVI